MIISRLYSSIGAPHGPTLRQAHHRQSSDQIVPSHSQMAPRKVDDRIMILAPIGAPQRRYRKELKKLAQDGFVRVRIDGELYPLDAPPNSRQAQDHNHRSRIDACSSSNGIASRLEQSIGHRAQRRLRLSPFTVVGARTTFFSEKLACPDCVYFPVPRA